MSKEAMLLKEVWVPGEASFKFSEQIDPHSGKGKFILQGLILPFNKISRNNVLYNKESIEQTHKQLIGRPVMYNHKVDDQLFPVGHFIDSNLKEDGWHYQADIDPEEKDLIRKLKRQDLRHVSIQVIGGRVVERQEEETGNMFTEAWISDVIEGSIVPAPGFLDTTAAFAEAIKTKKEKFAIEFNGTIKFKVDNLEGVTKRPDWDFFAAHTRIIDEEDGEVIYDDKKGGWQENLDEEVAAFIKDNPNPKDSKVHEFATSNGYDVDAVEEAIYKIATKKTEDATTATADGAIAPTQPLEDEKKKEASNEAVIDAFFQGLTSQSGSMSAHSNFLLSYKTIIAERKGSVVFVNKKNYSATTTSQTNLVKQKAKELGLRTQDVDANYWGQNADFQKAEQATFGKVAKDFLVKYGMKPSEVLELSPEEATKLATEKGWKPKIASDEGVADDKGITEKDVNPEELKMGIKVEMEHTEDEAEAKKIALDHLAEIPDYYTRLTAMEQEAEAKAERFIKTIGEKGVKAMLKDYF